MVKSLRFLGVFAIAAMVGGVLTSCSTPIEEVEAQNSSKNSVNLTLVSYAVTRNAYEKIIPLFTKQWKEKTGQTVTFKQQFSL